MATLKDTIAQIEETLKDGPHACRELERLSGGTANYVFRGTLQKPSSDGPHTVIVKYTPPYVANFPSFALTDTRCDIEVAMLQAKIPAAISNGITIDTPTVFSSKHPIQVHEDLPKSTTLKEYLLQNDDLSEGQSNRIGKALGSWTRSFHNWAQEPARTIMLQPLHNEMQKMAELKLSINYGRLVESIKSSNLVLTDEELDILTAVARTNASISLLDGHLIHGDFWTGNILVPQASPTSHEEDLLIYVIDWELSHFSSTAFDLGQMVAEMFELKHFKNHNAGVWLIQGFMDGYGQLDLDLAFKTAVHVGVHLVVWGSRVPGWGTPEQVEALMTIGKDFVVHGGKKDSEFFKNTILASMFEL